MTKKTHKKTKGNEFVTNHTNTHPDLENKINHLEKKNKELEEKLREAINYLEKKP